MTRPRELYPFHFANEPEERFNYLVLRGVVASVDQKRRHVDEVEAVDDRPIFHDAGDVELGGAIAGERLVGLDWEAG